MAQLNGFAIDIGWLKADHTYVTSSDGYVWPCWGRSAGGKRICSGQGSSARANCLSQPGSTAGIIYGLSGVCHQTANRILFPAGAIVSAAKGYWASTLLYGVYGTSSVPALIEWEARKLRCSSVSGDRAVALGLSKKAATAEAQPLAPKPPGERAFLDKLDKLHAQHASAKTIMALGKTSPSDLVAKEFNLIADYRLGTAKKPAQITTIRKAQAAAMKEFQALVLALNSRKLTGEDFATKVNALFATLLAKCAGTLNEEQYAKLFDVKPGDEVGIVDPKIMAQAHK
jgi:hypothetical protein